jgi:hypothetical protein
VAVIDCSLDHATWPASDVEHWAGDVRDGREVVSVCRREKALNIDQQCPGVSARHAVVQAKRSVPTPQRVVVWLTVTRAE